MFDETRRDAGNAGDAGPCGKKRRRERRFEKIGESIDAYDDDTTRRGRFCT